LGGRSVNLLSIPASDPLPGRGRTMAKCASRRPGTPIMPWFIEGDVPFADQ
jgi:hypothetical protein